MVFSLKSLFRPRPRTVVADCLYGEIVRQARSEAFYRKGWIPDTPEGRFAMIALHAFLLMDRLGMEEGEGELSQAVFDAMFDDMDRNLREMGVGDLSVGKKVKALARKFFATAAALRHGLNERDEALQAALKDDLLDGSVTDIRALEGLVAYVRDSVALLSSQKFESFADGKILFPTPLSTEQG